MGCLIGTLTGEKAANRMSIWVVGVETPGLPIECAHRIATDAGVVFAAFIYSLKGIK